MQSHRSDPRQNAKQLYSSEDVSQAIDRLAININAEFKDTEIRVLTILNGGLVFAGMLLPKLRMPLQLDYVHASRYDHGMVGKNLHWISKPKLDLTTQKVLVLDDIFDQGITLQEVNKYCKKHGATCVKTAVLAYKVLATKAEQDIAPPDYFALKVPDTYVFGMGMDYQGYWRNADGIFALGASDQNKPPSKPPSRANKK